MNARPYQSLSEVFGALSIDHGARDSAQCKCLTKYLNELSTKSHIVEMDYVDSGYLADYAGYYALCHDTPKKLTRRLHFFSLPPDKVNELWRQALASPADVAQIQGELNAAYLGFIVIKPLPATVIGKTCLRTYPDFDSESGRDRNYPIRRDYRVGLSGLMLNVQTVAFQEQDREIAACATAAIWSAMHAMPAWFTVHEIPSPFQITSSGSDGKIMPMEGETASRFPSNGMDVKQIVGCLRQHGIETSVVGLPITGGCTKLLEIVDAYLEAGTPILLVGDLFARRNGDVATRPGLHAVTILGHADVRRFKAGDHSARIERLYIHDDTLGPFASFSIEQCDEGAFVGVLGHQQIGAGAPALGSLERTVTTYLKNTSGPDHSVGVLSYVVPRYIIVPVNPKQHLPYSPVREFVELIYKWYVRAAPSAYNGQPVPPLSWAIQLADQTAFKSRLLNESAWVDAAAKEAILAESLPRLLWTVDFTTLVGNVEEVVAVLVLDATSLQQGGAVRNVLIGTGAQQVAATVFSIWLTGIEGYARSGKHGETTLPRLDPHQEASLYRLREQLNKVMS